MRLLSAIAMIALAGCASTPQNRFTNASITVPDMRADEARAYVAQRCIEGGGRLEINTPTQVVCAKAFDGSFGALMYRALLTPNYSTNPDAKVRYNFFESTRQVMVATDMYIEFENAYGQKNVNPIENVALRDQAQAMLQRMRDERQGQAPTGGQIATDVKAISTSSDPATIEVIARKYASERGCPLDFATVSDEDGRTIFESTCPTTRKRLLIECWTGICRALN